MKKQLFAIFLCAMFCCGCGSKEKQENMSDLEYVIVKEEEIPSELQNIIEERKTKPFKLTYEDQDLLYIAAGYGEQEGGGYSIQIKEAGVGNNAIYFKTELIGPKKEKRIEGIKSYPYLVIQTRQQEKPVVF